ncbi:MAG: substrate-binding domain-containing protein [Verrucomicrobiota bacterium]
MLQSLSRIARPLALFAALMLVGACRRNPRQADKKELLVYTGITMAKPMAEITAAIEQKHNVSIVMTQGGSEDLYISLRSAGKGDLYMPGSTSYRKKHFAEGLLGEFVSVGYNQAVFMVPKGNPKGITANIDQMLRDDVAIVLCNPESGSIGRETAGILEAAGVFEEAFRRCEYLTTDSRNLNKALRNGDADLIVNWRATAFFPENKESTEIIDLPSGMARPKELQLTLLKFSQHPDIARKVMAYAASPAGQAIFRKYGFVDAQGKSEK